MFSLNDTIPTVAIVGKPNVGKSSLFNRLIRRQKAIISDEPGVTRDINYEIVTNDKISYRLADSAGFSSSRETIAHLTQNRNKRLMDEATIVLFMCDIGGLSTEDFELAKIIRRSGKPCILIINKVDNEKNKEAIYDFFDLGIEEPLPISVLQGKNIGILQEAIAKKVENCCQNKITVEKDTKVSSKSEKEDNSVKIAIVGKPNVGKSSLLNLLVNSERSLVTPYPGTTRDAVDATILYKGYKIQFVDTAGIRKRGKIQENIEFFSLVRTERAVKDSIISVLLIDAETGITTQDKKIASLIVNEKKGLIIAANKWDRAEDKGINPREFIKDVYFYFPHISFADVVTISAKTGYNKIKLLKNILTVYNNYTLKIKTSELNSFIRNIDLHGAHIKYGIQKSTAPPVFEFFISRSSEINRNFKQFINNSIRKKFDLKGVPIEVNLRKK